MFVFWRNQNNRNGLTPANGISPNFVLPQKFLSDSNILKSSKPGARHRHCVSPYEIFSNEPSKNRPFHLIKRCTIALFLAAVRARTLKFRGRRGRSLGVDLVNSVAATSSQTDYNKQIMMTKICRMKIGEQNGDEK